VNVVTETTSPQNIALHFSKILISPIFIASSLKILLFQIDPFEHKHIRLRKSLQHMSDIYDSPRWTKVAGPLGNRLNRIVLQGCVDGCPAYGRQQSGSVKPFQYFICNLPPWLRYQLRHLLVHVLIPAQLKGPQSKKYYDYLGAEMTDLYLHGVDGTKVIVFGTTLDTPGRRELLNMQAVQAFYPCPHCLHTWQPGMRGQTYGGYRRYLPVGSPWRNKQFLFNGLVYQFRDEESRPPPKLRNDRNVALMSARGTPKRPFCGHKGPPLLNTWTGVDWEGNICDKMHDWKLLCEMGLKGLVGGRSTNGMYKAWSTKKKILNTVRIAKLMVSFPNFIHLPTPRRRGDSVQRNLTCVTDVSGQCGGHTTWIHLLSKVIRFGHIAIGFGSAVTKPTLSL